ncbi:MAG: sensor histidine kinase, partial [Ktedonobacterales bacterium]
AADHVSISVADRGMGIPEDVLPHLFERFYRAPAVRSEHISGMGIGLYIVREVVSLHGGTVTVESKQGKGSTFTIHLPLVAPAESVPNKEMSNNDLPATNEPK